MSNLITVPTFNFSQGNSWDGAELPINVQYFNNGDEIMVCLEQEERTINFTDFSQLEKLVKEIKKHLPEATKNLSNKK